MVVDREKADRIRALRVAGKTYKEIAKIERVSFSEIAEVVKGKPTDDALRARAAGFSHNTLRQHLDRLVDQGLVARLKNPRKGPGRPLYTYGLQKGAERAVSALLDPSMGLVVVSFEGLSRFCKREKGGFCKEIRGRCTPWNCPQIVR